LNIAIVGAGPAGLICALQLAQQDHSVTIYEKKTNLDTQGSGLLVQTIGLEVLELLNIRQEIELLGRKISHIQGTAFPSGRKIVDVDYTLLGGTDYAIGIDRNALWSVLFEKIHAVNIRFIKSATVIGLSYQVNGKVVPRIKEESITESSVYDLIVDASGALSSLHEHAFYSGQSQVLQYGALWCSATLTAQSRYNSNVMTLYSDKRNVGIGVLPTGSTCKSTEEFATLFFNINLNDFPAWDDDQFQKWKDQSLYKWSALSHLIDQITTRDQVYLAKFIQHTLAYPFGDRIVFIGDSAHASSPLLGQGISHAMIDAITLPWALTQESDIQAALKLYHKKRKFHVQTYQMLAKVFTPFYQSDNRFAIAARDALYPLVAELLLMRKVSPFIISGQLGRPTNSAAFIRVSPKLG